MFEKWKENRRIKTQQKINSTQESANNTLNEDQYLSSEQKIIKYSHLCQGIMDLNKQYGFLGDTSAQTIFLLEEFRDLRKFNNFNPEKYVLTFLHSYPNGEIYDLTATINQMQLFYRDYELEFYRRLVYMPPEVIKRLHLPASKVKRIEKQWSQQKYPVPPEYVIHIKTHYSSPGGKSQRSMSYAFRPDDIYNLTRAKNEKVKQQGTLLTTDEDFLEHFNGALVEDIPGCYVILIFNGQPDAFFSNYEDVYVGQSVNVYKRLRNHLTGHGNGDVYAEVKYGKQQGKQIFVQIIPCRKEELNDKEVELISKYNATDSFNRTVGGSAKRI